jgi:tetratricopeptide (TPR) repeat protein
MTTDRLFGAAQIIAVREWVGRDPLLAELSADFCQGRKVLVLHGQGGIGKTSLAIKLIEACGIDISLPTLPPNCPYHNVLYCKIDDSDSFSLVEEFLNAFGMAANRATATAGQLLEMVLTKLHNERWLVVIDNLEYLMEPGGNRCKSPEIGNLIHCLAYGGHHSQTILVTRQSPSVDLADRELGTIDPRIVRIEEIRGISPADSVHLLEDLGALDTQTDLDWIADRVHGNISALRLLAEYSKQSDRRLRQHPELITDEIKPIVEALWAKQKGDAQELLKRICVLRIEMSAKALTTLRLLTPDNEHPQVTPAAELETAALLDRLVTGGWLSKTGDGDYVMPRSISEALQAIFHQELPHLWVYGAYFYASFEHPPKFRSLGDWRLFLEELHFWWLLGKCETIAGIVIGSLLPALEQWCYWSLQHKWCMKILPYTKGHNHRYCLRILGCIYRDTGRSDEAESYFENSLALAEQEGSSSGIAASLTLLGDIAIRRGNWDKAEQLFQQSLKLRTELGDRSGMATSWGQLGDIARNRGDWDKAETLFQKSLKIQTELGDRSGMATSWNVLGYLAHKRGHWAEAEGFYQQCLEIRTKLGDRAGMAISLSVLGNISRNRGDWDKAETLFQKSLKLRIELGDRGGMAISLSVLGDIARKQEQWDKAEAFYLQCLQIRTKLGVGATSPVENRAGMATCWICLGDIARHRGDWDRAEVMFKKSLQLYTELGVVAGMGICWGCLGENELARGNLAAAEVWLKKALTAMEDLNMLDGIAETHWDLAQLYRAQGDNKKGQIHYDLSHNLFTQIGAKRDLAIIKSKWLEAESIA